MYASRGCAIKYYLSERTTSSSSSLRALPLLFRSARFAYFCQGGPLICCSEFSLKSRATRYGSWRKYTHVHMRDYVSVYRRKSLFARIHGCAHAARRSLLPADVPLASYGPRKRRLDRAAPQLLYPHARCNAIMRQARRVFILLFNCDFLTPSIYNKIQLKMVFKLPFACVRRCTYAPL